MAPGSARGSRGPQAPAADLAQEVGDEGVDEVGLLDVQRVTRLGKDGEAGCRDHPLQPHARLQAAVVLVAGQDERRRSRSPLVRPAGRRATASPAGRRASWQLNPPPNARPPSRCTPARRGGPCSGVAPATARTCIAGRRQRSPTASITLAMASHSPAESLHLMRGVLRTPCRLHNQRPDTPRMRHGEVQARRSLPWRCRRRAPPRRSERPARRRRRRRRAAGNTQRDLAGTSDGWIAPGAVDDAPVAPREPPHLAAPRCDGRRRTRG